MLEEETNKIFLMISNEYDDFLPEGETPKETDERLEMKFNLWHESLKKYDYRQVYQATAKMLHTHKYGTPKLAHLMAILNPVMEKENIGQEFAERFVFLLRRLGGDNMENAIYQEYGEIGREIYLNNKFDARRIADEDITTFKAQIRNSFNSKYERKQKGHGVLENKVTLMIEDQFFGREVI